MTGLQIINNIMCSFEGGYSSEGSEKEAFQRHVNLDALKQWTRLA